MRNHATAINLAALIESATAHCSERRRVRREMRVATAGRLEELASECLRLAAQLRAGPVTAAQLETAADFINATGEAVEDELVKVEDDAANAS